MQEGLYGKLKMTDIDFAILNSHVTSVYLMFIKRTYTEKTEKFISTKSFIENNNVFDFGVKISIIHA